MKPIEIWQVDSVIGKGEKDGDIRRHYHDSKQPTKYIIMTPNNLQGTLS